ncbi:hypothetical protein ACOCEA_04905 [Maribacter sp. CXY002]|uniref:hypothetical protein n=1 Tax=Maribacter luteocoastalis TaxID=3407671 RepID=UPI003B6819A1
MVIVKLTEELLPHFIFLVDGIEDSNNDLVVSTLLQECREKGIETSWHSLSRALTFRKILKEGLQPKQTYHIPKKKTLDALTKYYYGEAFVFRDLVRNSNDIDVNPSEVSTHYKKCVPRVETVVTIFEKKEEKIEHLNEQSDACIHFLKELESCSLKQFIEDEVNQRFDLLKNEIKDELEVKSELIGFLENRLEKLERKKIFSHFIYRFFGSFGLFFVNIDYDEIGKIEMLEDFLDTYEGLTDDDAIDEFL